jgi:hypothetical protein
MDGFLAKGGAEAKRIGDFTAKAMNGGLMLAL